MYNHKYFRIFSTKCSLAGASIVSTLDLPLKHLLRSTSAIQPLQMLKVHVSSNKKSWHWKLCPYLFLDSTFGMLDVSSMDGCPQRTSWIVWWSHSGTVWPTWLSLRAVSVRLGALSSFWWVSHVLSEVLTLWGGVYAQAVEPWGSINVPDIRQAPSHDTLLVCLLFHLLVRIHTDEKPDKTVCGFCLPEWLN